ncbi:hypothetical protein O3P69_003317 [Scylla paramamosain]|uniref:Uncharacterized protein n=1 Tax=Scylla paramamosain TaxID=85552 RepID=A0AAW0UQT1_SCYPA
MCPEMSAEAALGAWHRPPEAAETLHQHDGDTEERTVIPVCSEERADLRQRTGDDSDSDISVGCPSPRPGKEDPVENGNRPPQDVSEALEAAPASTPSPGAASGKYQEDGVTSPESAMSPPAARSPLAKEGGEDEYFKPLKKLRMVQLQQEEAALAARTQAGVKSFSIAEILNHKPVVAKAPEATGARIVRPWDTDDDDDGSRPQSVDDMSVSSASSSVGSPRPVSSGPGSTNSGHSQARPRGKDGNPLDALFQMTSKTFEGLKSGQQPGEYPTSSPPSPRSEPSHPPVFPPSLCLIRATSMIASLLPSALNDPGVYMNPGDPFIVAWRRSLSTWRVTKTPGGGRKPLTRRGTNKTGVAHNSSSPGHDPAPGSHPALHLTRVMWRVQVVSSRGLSGGLSPLAGRSMDARDNIVEMLIRGDDLVFGVSGVIGQLRKVTGRKKPLEEEEEEEEEELIAFTARIKTHPGACTALPHLSIFSTQPQPAPHRLAPTLSSSPSPARPSISQPTRQFSPVGQQGAITLLGGRGRLLEGKGGIDYSLAGLSRRDPRGRTSARVNGARPGSHQHTTTNCRRWEKAREAKGRYEEKRQALSIASPDSFNRFSRLFQSLLQALSIASPGSFNRFSRLFQSLLQTLSIASPGSFNRFSRLFQSLLQALSIASPDSFNRFSRLLIASPDS